MKSMFERIYNDDEDYYLTIQMCPCCKYVYKEKRDNKWDTEIVAGDKPFIELLEKGLYKDEYDDVKRITQYICPKCGIIQADIGDIE